MIQNPIILEKLESKTAGDVIMYDFLVAIMTNESEGKQYSKFYSAEVEKGAKKREQIGGDNK
ncbi:MAG: hypothetical protein Q8865_03905 [Bacillota bacterium]|nr:hypothetical protein [Bacillota bacterium]